MVISLCDTLYLFPKSKTLFLKIIENEYVLDVGLGISIFVIIIVYIMINKGISKAIKYTGIGGLDKILDSFLDFTGAYILLFVFFQELIIVYNTINGQLNEDQSYVFPIP